MNRLTQVRNANAQRLREVKEGIDKNGGSYHERFRKSAYVYVGGLSFKLTEGDVLAVMEQYGSAVDVNLVKDKETGTSRGFCFLAYADQRSTDLAVDNLNGAIVAGRTLSVEHVLNYEARKTTTTTTSSGRYHHLANAAGDNEDNNNGNDGDARGARAAGGGGEGKGETESLMEEKEPAAGRSSFAPWGGSGSVFEMLTNARLQKQQREEKNEAGTTRGGGARSSGRTAVEEDATRHAQKMQEGETRQQQEQEKTKKRKKERRTEEEKTQRREEKALRREKRKEKKREKKARKLEEEARQPEVRKAELEDEHTNR